jgi:sugar lactone lactonase YvrE
MRTISFILIPLGLSILYNKQILTQVPVINNPIVTRLDDGFQFVEGPVWKNDLGLLFSDIPSNTVYLWSQESGRSIYMNPSGNSNGLAFDSDGLLILAQHGPRQISRLETGSALTPIATHYLGKRFNSPNDMALHSDGSIFFTDPPYGLMDQGGTSELGYNGIFRLSPTGDVQLLDSTLNRPNGICFSPDESRLYVSDSEVRRIYVWDVVGDTTITNKMEFAFMQPAGYADGMKVDSAGFLYATGPIGVWIFSQEGEVIDTIPVPGQTSNCCWGGEDGKTLYVTSGNAVYKIENRNENPEVLDRICAEISMPALRKIK